MIYKSLHLIFYRFAPEWLNTRFLLLTADSTKLTAANAIATKAIVGNSGAFGVAVGFELFVLLLGLRVGVFVGCEVGLAVGLEVGAGEDTAEVGVGDGLEVGAIVGLELAEGLLVGDGVGEGLGVGLGANVAEIVVAPLMFCIVYELAVPTEVPFTKTFVM